MSQVPTIERKPSTKASAPAIAAQMAYAYAKDGRDTLLVSHDGKLKANRTKSASIDDALARACFMAQRPSNGGIAVVIDNQPVHVNGKAYYPIQVAQVEKLVKDLQLAVGTSLGLIYVQE